MKNDLVIVSPLDQSVETEHQYLLDSIKEKVEESVNAKDVSIIMDTLLSFVKAAKLSGLALACGLYLTNEKWEVFEIDDEFIDFAYVTLGLHRHTVDRYIDVWAMYDEQLIPEEFEARIMQQNIGNQAPIAKALAQGVEFDDDAWENLSEATSDDEIRAIIRDVKDSPPRKGSLQIFMDRDGSLKSLQDGIYCNVGYLDISSGEEAVVKAINRIVSNSGILRR